MVSSVWELNAKGEKHNFFGFWRPEKLTLRLDASVMGIDLALGIKQSRERHHTQHETHVYHDSQKPENFAMARWPAWDSPRFSGIAHKHAHERAERRGAYLCRSGRRIKATGHAAPKASEWKKNHSVQHMAALPCTLHRMMNPSSSTSWWCCTIPSRRTTHIKILELQSKVREQIMGI